MMQVVCGCRHLTNFGLLLMGDESDEEGDGDGDGKGDITKPGTSS